MEGQKHFSHNHNLNRHQVNEGTEIICSGCKSKATGTIYVCFPCNFYLHENCYGATRSLNHPSHPSHPLTLVPYSTYPSNTFFCNTCSLIGAGFSYSCSNCEFDLHINCAYSHSPHQNLSPPYQTPNFINHHSMTSHPIQHNTRAPNSFESQSSDTRNTHTGNKIMHFTHKHALRLVNLNAEEDNIDCSGCEKVISGQGYKCPKSRCDFHLDNSCFQLAQEIRHKAHPNHPLTLLSTPPYESSRFACNACSNSGCGFTYHCVLCQFDLHVQCASLTEIVKREDHQHPLQLNYSCPSQAEDYEFECNVCHSIVPNDNWVYYCEECDYGTHVDCVNCEVTEASESESENEESETSTGNPLLDAQLQMQRLQLRMQISRQTAQMMMSMGQNACSLTR